MVELKSPAAIAAMREAGQVVARALGAVRDAAKVGTSLIELDDIAAGVLADAGAVSTFKGYRPAFAPTPFPAVICASVNDVIVHGIPDRYRLRDGYLVSVDCGAELAGWTGDAATSFVVGTARPEDLRLIAAAEDALAAGSPPPAPAGGSATSRTPSARCAGGGATASPTGSAGTASAGGCTRTRTSPTTAGPAGASRCTPAWCSRSSRCCSPAAATATAPTRTAGRCARRTAAAPPMWNTRSLSRRTGPGC